MTCPCYSCVEKKPHWPFATKMIVCPVCGNKRCPKATHHDHACTGSNDYGQPGSRYSDEYIDPRPTRLIRAADGNISHHHQKQGGPSHD